MSMMDNEEYAFMFSENMKLTTKIAKLHDQEMALREIISDLISERMSLSVQIHLNSEKMTALSEDHA